MFLVFIFYLEVVFAWGLPKLSNSSLYSYTYLSGASDTDVYVLDTGIDIYNDEFQGRASWGANFVDDIDADCNGHGTHVAGIIGSATFGVHKLSNLIAVKVLGCNGRSSDNSIIDGVSWVIGQHERKKQRISIINMSLSSGNKSTEFQKLISRATSLGIIVIAAAGNNYTDACRFFPAGYSEVITVGATTINDNYALFSNHGKCVDILAPGQSILSTYIGGKTMVLSGTSMAAPFVSGVASLLSSYCHMSAKDVVEKIKNTARKNIINDVPQDTVNLLLFSDKYAVDCPLLYHCSELNWFLYTGALVLIPLTIVLTVALIRYSIPYCRIYRLNFN